MYVLMYVLLLVIKSTRLQDSSLGGWKTVISQVCALNMFAMEWVCEFGVIHLSNEESLPLFFLTSNIVVLTLVIEADTRREGSCKSSAFFSLVLLVFRLSYIRILAVIYYSILIHILVG